MKKLVAWFKALFAPRPVWKDPKKWDAQFETLTEGAIDTADVVGTDLKEARGPVEAKLPRVETPELDTEDLIVASTEAGFYQKPAEMVEAELPSLPLEKEILSTKPKRKKPAKISPTPSKARSSGKKPRKPGPRR